jgi:hypothetical protein
MKKKKIKWAKTIHHIFHYNSECPPFDVNNNYSPFKWSGNYRRINCKKCIEAYKKTGIYKGDPCLP